MKKKLLLCLAFILLVLGALFTLLAYNANRLLAGYKPQLEAALSSAVGSKVALGKLNTSIFPTVRILASDISIGQTDSSDFSLKDLVFELKLIPLLKGAIQIAELKVVEPHITVRKSASGLSLAGIKPQPAADNNSATPSNTQTKTAPAQGGLPGWLSLSLDSIALENGAVIYIDQTSNKSYQLQKLNYASAIQLNAPNLNLPKFNFSAVLQNGIKFEAQGENISYNLENSQASLGELALDLFGNKLFASGKVNLKSLLTELQIAPSSRLKLESLKHLRTEIPALAELELSGEIRPDLQLSLNPPHKILAQGAINLNALALQKGELKISDLNSQIKLNADQEGSRAQSEKLSLLINGTPLLLKFLTVLHQDLRVDPLEIEVVGGKIDGSLLLDPNNKQFESRFKASSLSLGPLVGIAKPAMANSIIGQLKNADGQISASIAGEPLPSLKGNLSFEVVDSSIPGLNLAGSVLRSVKDLPFLQAGLISAVPKPLLDQINQDSTVVKNLSASLTIRDAKAHTSDLKLISSIFSLEGAGWIGFDQSLDLNATIYFSPEFSKALVDKVKELVALLDEQQRLVIPLRLQGKVPSVSVTPDMGKLLKKGAIGALKGKAGDLLNKALGGGKSGGKGAGLGDLLGF